jgi:hypothetical protein
MAETAPELLDKDGREHVFIFQDESTFHANDFQNVSFYLKPGEVVLKKKERGRLIMVSGYICERFGNLALTDEMIADNLKLPSNNRLNVVDSRTIIYPTSKESGDDYWNMDQMIIQVYLFTASAVN